MRRTALVLGALTLAAYASALGWIEFRSRAFGAIHSIASEVKTAPVVAVTFYDDRPAFRRLRAVTAAQLLEAGQADFLVAVGGWRPGRDSYVGSRVMRDEALSRNIRPERVMHDAGSNDSVSNLAGARAIIDERIGQPAAIVLVSDRYHLLRLSFLARKAGLTGPLRFHATPDELEPSARLGRLNHELLAYVSMLLPSALVNAVIGRLRHAAFDASSMKVT